MAYTYREAIKTAYKYLNIDESKVQVIDETNGRGIVYDFNGVKTVIFIYPISCKQNNKQNFFDTRDSGAKERGIAWEYAKANGLRYFCLGFNEEQDRYKDYVLSLESDEDSISNISFRKASDSEATGTQVNIPNDFLPTRKFERIRTPKGFFISAIKKDHAAEYIELFDNRPYMFDVDLEFDDEDPEDKNRRLFSYWMSLQVKPDGDSNAGEAYSESTISQYVSDINGTMLPMYTDKSVFYSTNIDEVQVTIECLLSEHDKYYPRVTAIKKYLEYLKDEDAKKDYAEILNHSLWGIHIQKKNNALSEENPHVCIGWSAMGDLTGLDTDEKLTALYEKTYPENTNNRSKGQDVGQLRRFTREVNVGDYIIFAQSDVFHIGRVESDYYYDVEISEEQDPDYKNTRKVKWLKKNISRKTLSKQMHSSLATSMSIFGINDYRAVIVDILKGTYKKDDDLCNGIQAISELKYVSGFNSQYKRNRILFGAPGTGKSFNLNKERKVLIGADNETDYERVTFHPDYSYANFVGTYKPVMVKNKSSWETDDDKKEIAYEYVPGPFMRVLVKALKSCMDGSNKPYLLVVEEINRANVAAVFGDVFQLLDRDEKSISEYSIATTNDMRAYLAEALGVEESAVETIKIPDNMFIWATMNSADQGVFPMDTAFKRRWDFTYLGINDAVEEYSEKIKNRTYILGKGDKARSVSWNALREAINNTLSSDDYNINEDKLLGPYFIAKPILESDNDQDFIDAFKNKVLMYLFDDAVKQKRKTFFEQCPSVRYSDICKLFEEKGVYIFPSEISKQFTEAVTMQETEEDKE